MTHYIALVHKDANSAYGVTFPDLPGCFSAADEEQDLIANAIDALALWAEDGALPTPSSIATIRTMGEIARELRDGAFLLAVPAPAVSNAA